MWSFNHGWTPSRRMRRLARIDRSWLGGSCNIDRAVHGSNTIRHCSKGCFPELPTAHQPVSESNKQKLMLTPLVGSGQPAGKGLPFPSSDNESIEKLKTFPPRFFLCS
ncbi:hypothetical protein AAMO2058_000253700 [Amorphochlora amoebiformis]